MLDAVIVGGGPVGLLLGGLLAQRGLSFRVLEARPAPSPHSRAIGIHPPALEAFARLGLADALLAAGVPIPRGVVRGEGRVLGDLGFAGVSREYPFVLSLPQQGTEVLLERRLDQLAPGSLRRGVRVLGVREGGNRVTVEVQDGEEVRTLEARFVVGADGRQSTVRREAGIPYRGGTYPDRYLMGDFPDTTPYGPDAVIHLAAGGVVESFPLPGGVRRWVARTDRLYAQPRPQDLTALLRGRTGLHVPAGECSMLSPFEVRHHLAGRMVRGRTILIGDAAHEVSPIGGQGMNLGWLDAAELAPLLGLDDRRAAPALRHFALRRRRSAWLATRQAELNMFFGRPGQGWGRRLNERLIEGLLAPPSPGGPLLARAFTMRWL